jgi:hypothetical protein
MACTKRVFLCITASCQARARDLLFGLAQRVGMIRTNPNHEATKVIDNQDQTERLLRKLTEVLPLSALATPPLMANLRGRSSAAEITMNCKVTKVFYLGDEGGITCQVTFDEKKRRCSSCRSLTSPLIAGSLLRAR